LFFALSRYIYFHLPTYNSSFLKNWSIEILADDINCFVTIHCTLSEAFRRLYGIVFVIYK